MRPWQHVLDPLWGYIVLAECLFKAPNTLTGSWNFGPSGKALNVGEVVKRINLLIGKQVGVIESAEGFEDYSEAQVLLLDSSKAFDTIGWRPIIQIDQALKMTVDWYLSEKTGLDMNLFTSEQIDSFEKMSAPNIKELKTGIDGVTQIHLLSNSDHRGYFQKLFCLEELSCWRRCPIKQINRTMTVKRGTIRGFHLQKRPYAEKKYITCVSGSVLDVALDLRSDSQPLEIF